VKRIFYLAALFCITAISPAWATDLYQWIDSRGIIHFTDNLNNVPAKVRASSDLTVRPNFLTPSEPAPAPPLLPVPTAESRAEPPAENASPSTALQETIHYAPHETTIIVVNSHRASRLHRCVGNRCAPAFRPDFNDRRYIHPSVFDGGSRQYIQP
jgi:hypothetical protein